MNVLIIIGLIILLFFSYNFGSYLNKNHFYFIGENDKSFYGYVMITVAGFVFSMLFAIILYMGYELVSLFICK